MTQLDGKVILVTGAGGAIGVACSALMAQRGAHIVAVDQDGAALEKLKDNISNNNLTCIVADVCDESAVEEYIASSLEISGRLDVLVNNAGIEGNPTTIDKLSVSDFEQVMRINVTSVFLGMKHALPSMAANGAGSIVNVSSVAGLRGSAKMAAYVSSKHAVVGLTRSAAREWGPKGVRVNSINPGAVQGRMMTAIQQGISPDSPDTVHKSLEENIPLGKYAQPSEVAAMIAFLASDDASHVNGAVHIVDGGSMA